MCSFSSSKQTLFSVNSAGDVFCQRLGSIKTDDDNDQMKLYLDPWCQAVKSIDLQMPVRPLNFSAEWSGKNLANNGDKI